ncbi:Acylamidase [compost metagenome]
MLTGQDHFWRARLWLELEKLPEDKRSEVLPYILEWAGSARDLSATQIVDGFAQTFEMRRTTAELFRQCDFLVSPTNQISAYPAHWPSPSNDPMKPFEHIAFTLPFNMGEQPALSINCGFTAAGMPIGLQLATPRYQDAFLMQLGRLYEDARGAITNWPQPTI